MMAPGELTNATVAGAALTSPVWLPALHTISEVAALLFPILGGVWFAVQIVAKLLQLYQAHRSRKPR
jgi:hypothetical protein